MSARQIAQAQMTNARANQLFHLVAEREKHPANLPVNSLTQDNANTGGPDDVHIFDSRPLSIEHDSAPQFQRETRVPRPVQRHFVFLFHFVTRMREALREVAVIRQDEEAFRLRVEPADFYRVFRVHDTIDAGKIEAELKNGVLTVHLPKEAKHQPRQVTIKSQA